METNCVKIGNIEISDNKKVLIVAELGVTHNGSVAEAKQLMKAAVEAGMDIIKCEMFVADRLVGDRNMIYKTMTNQGPYEKNYYQLLKDLEFSKEELIELKRYADELNIPFFGTCFDFEEIDFAVENGFDAIKFSSGEITHYPLLQYGAKTGLPIFIDTGGSLLFEVEKAVMTVRNEGNENVIIMHNPSGYPAVPERTNLRMIQSIKNICNKPVGLSCHTPGRDAVIAAVAIGANAIEKPLTLDKNYYGDEHIFSLQIDEFKEYVEAIRFIEKAMGKNERFLDEFEEAIRKAGRQSLIAAIDLKEGDILSLENTRFARPNKGIIPEHIDIAIGRKIRQNIGKNEFITWGHV